MSTVKSLGLFALAAATLVGCQTAQPTLESKPDGSVAVVDDSDVSDSLASYFDAFRAQGRRAADVCATFKGEFPEYAQQLPSIGFVWKQDFLTKNWINEFTVKGYGKQQITASKDTPCRFSFPQRNATYFLEGVSARLTELGFQSTGGASWQKGSTVLEVSGEVQFQGASSWSYAWIQHK